MTVYTYALTHRPPQPGTYPTEHLAGIESTETMLADGTRVYGYAHYDKPLTREQVSSHELTEFPIIQLITNVKAPMAAHDILDKTCLNHFTEMLRVIIEEYKWYHLPEDYHDLTGIGKPKRRATVPVRAITDLTDRLPEPTNWMMTFLIQGEPAETFAGLDPEKITDRCATLHESHAYRLPD